MSKVAIVTGAGGMKATGRGIALWLARDGYDIVLVDIRRSEAELPPQELRAKWRGIESVAEEISALGRKALPSYTDIRSADQIDAMMAEAVKKFGHVDALVNNARAFFSGGTHVVDLDEREWDRNMEVNAKGTFLCSRAVARHLIANGIRGKIVNITSSGGRIGGKGIAAYCASKVAINGFMKCLALELAPHGITVNDVSAGLIDSGRFSVGSDVEAARAGVSVEEYEKERIRTMSKAIPTGRPATADDIAAMVAFLVSPAASQITGQSINVNGGSVMS